MHKSSNPISPDDRAKIAKALDASLNDGVDLYSQIKVAHWNVKGPHFASLHPLFDSFAAAAAEANDEIAERAVALGALTSATSRRTAQASRLAELPADKTDGLALVGLLLERFDTYLTGLRTAREIAAELGDGDTEDLLTQHVTAFEKHAWFLHATLAR
jgi:starvation-inducible DNA-binding protein